MLAEVEAEAQYRLLHEALFKFAKAAGYSFQQFLKVIHKFDLSFCGLRHFFL